AGEQIRNNVLPRELVARIIGKRMIAALPISRDCTGVAARLNEFCTIFCNRRVSARITSEYFLRPALFLQPFSSPIDLRPVSLTEPLSYRVKQMTPFSLLVHDCEQ